MPTTRWLVKRDLEQCLIRLDGIQGYLTRSGHLYEPDHPKEYEMFCVLMAVCEQLAEGLKSLRERL